MLRSRIFPIILNVCLMGIFPSLQTYAQSLKTNVYKPRVVILTDIAPASCEPDDMESMIRLLAHADLLEIEALIASGGWNSSGGLYPIEWMDSLKSVVNAYEMDVPNLMKRSEQLAFSPLEEENGKQRLGYWPSPEYLRGRIRLGSRGLGVERLGADNDSDGSNLLIRLVDESDDRPLWICAWGGANTLAQALWRVKHDRSEAELDRFLSKLYVYTITDQDVPISDNKNYKFSSHQWIRKEFGNKLHFIWDDSAWLTQNGLGSENWDEYASHIQGHGYMGKIYPKNKYGVEGDTPSFLYVLPNGLSDPTCCNQAGWGGYFVWTLSLDNETSCFTNSMEPVRQISQKYERYFYPAIFANFAARMDWAESGKGNRNPVVIIGGEKGYKVVHRSVKSGKDVRLDASKTFDPDGDSMEYKWWILPEAGSCKLPLSIEHDDAPVAMLHVPETGKGTTIHVICEVTDNGNPRLTGYRRYVFHVK